MYIKCVNLYVMNKLFIVGNFELRVGSGQFTDSEIIVMLGENGTGKTTFIRILAGKLIPDEGGSTSLPLFQLFRYLPECSLNTYNVLSAYREIFVLVLLSHFFTFVACDRIQNCAEPFSLCVGKFKT